MAQQKELVEIVWNDEKKGFVRKDNGRKVRNALPVGPLSSSRNPHQYSTKTSIEELAKKYTPRGTIGYEKVLAANDVGGGEFFIGQDVYAFRIYKIS